MDDKAEVTELLRAYAGGDEAAFDRLAPLVYDHLRGLARAQLSRRRRNTLETTALVHEAYLKLAAQQDASWQDRQHFYCACAQAMRHILVDAARRRMSQKRGAGDNAATLPDDLPLRDEHAELVLAVHEALDKLRAIDPDLCRVVECRYFIGYSGTETAAALGVSERTAYRLWERARAWLKVELGSSFGGELRTVDPPPDGDNGALR